MGRGVAINEFEDGLIEVRMENGQREKFYPEELETEAEVDAKFRNDTSRNWRIGE